MLRNIAALLLVGNILYKNYKLNIVECTLLFLIMFLYFFGNITFYILDYFPKNPFFHFIIYGGQTWNEFPTTFSIMIVLMVYLLLTRQVGGVKK